MKTLFLPFAQKYTAHFVLVLLVLCYGSLHFIGLPVENSTVLAGILLVCSLFSLFLFFQKAKWILPVCIGISVFLQGSFVFLSDAHNDIYKYLWEGYGSAQRMNIYESHGWLIYETFPPQVPEGQELWEKVNFKKYYTTYPPLPQLVFWLSATIAPFSQVGLKSIFLLFQLGSMGLMWKIFSLHRHYKKWLSVLFLSPLFLWEGTATGHTEVLFVFFLLLTIFFWQKQRLFWTGIALAGLIWTKFFPAILIPIFLAEIWRCSRHHQNEVKIQKSVQSKDEIKIMNYELRITNEEKTQNSKFRIQNFNVSFLKNIFFFGLGGILMTFLVWYPFFPFDYSYLQEGLKLYTDRWQMSPLFFAFFETYWGREIASSIHLLATLSMVLIMSIATKISLEQKIFGVICTFLLFSSTVFSWYFLWLFPLIPLVWDKKYWRFLLIPLFIAPLQYVFGYIDPEFGFRYASNGAELDQILLFWGMCIVGAIGTFFWFLRRTYWQRC